MTKEDLENEKERRGIEKDLGVMKSSVTALKDLKSDMDLLVSPENRGENLPQSQSADKNKPPKFFEPNTGPFSDQWVERRKIKNLTPEQQAAWGRVQVELPRIIGEAAKEISGSRVLQSALEQVTAMKISPNDTEAGAYAKYNGIIKQIEKEINRLENRHKKIGGVLTYNPATGEYE